MLRVTPIYGSRWEEQGSATLGSCTLVEYAGVRVLVNVGGPLTAAVVQAGDSIEEERSMPPLPDHDCLLLTDSTLEHMGNLPLYCKQQRQLQQQQRMVDEDTGHVTMPPLKPIYATFPTVKMGQMALYDYHANLCLDGGCPPFTLEELDSAFAQLQTIKYSQTIHLPLDNDLGGNRSSSSSSSNSNNKGKNYKKPKPQLAITAHRAGHVVGGAFYVMQRVQDETAVVMTATYHIAKELHLESSTLLQHGATPDVLITHPGGPAMKWLSQLYTPPPKVVGIGNKKTITNKQQPKLLKPVLVAQAERNVTEHVMNVLRRDGNVLLPVDASGRVLELVLLLSQHWDRQRLQGTYNLIWLGPMVPNILEFSRSQLEWMNGTLGNQFDSPSFGGGAGGKNVTGSKGGGGGGFSGGGHPYMLKSVQRCTSIEQVQAIMEDNGNPTCVLATGLSLDHGPARDMLLQWADNDNNSILFTNSSQCQARPWVQNNKWRQQNAGGVASGMDLTATTTTTTTLNTLASTDAEAIAVTASVNSAAAAASAATVTGVTTTGLSGTTTTTTTTTVDVAEDGATTAVIEDHANVVVGEALPNDQDLSEYTTSYQLLYQWAKAQWEDREMEDSITVDVLVPHRSALKGAELKQFLDQEEAARVSKRKLEQERAMLREVELAKGRLRLGEAEGTTTTNTGTTTSTSMSADGASKSDGTKGAMVKSPMASARPKKKNRFDSTLFLKFSKPLHLTFEVREEAVGVGQIDSTAKFGIGESVGHQSEVLEDDYGIAVIPDHFIDIVSGVDPSKFAGGTGRIGEDVLRRGFGFGVVGGAGDPTTGGGKSKKKRGSNPLGDDDIDDGEDDMDERGFEAADLSEGRGIIRGRNGRQPTKVGCVPRLLQVFAEIAYIPLEGRVDSRAARQSVRALQPRQVVVLGGSKPTPTIVMEDQSLEDENDEDTNAMVAMEVVDEVRLLAEAAESFATTNREVQTPSDLETVELEVGHAAYSVRLIDTPYQTKEEKEINEELPEAIELYEAKLGACSVSLLDYVATGQKVALDGSIVLAPRPTASNHPAIYVSDGEVLLTDLRSELIAQGMKAEYSAHAGYSQLVVNGKIVVKKEQDSGRIDVEGPLCEDFFTVRSVVCGQYVTL